VVQRKPPKSSRPPRRIDHPDLAAQDRHGRVALKELELLLESRRLRRVISAQNRDQLRARFGQRLVSLADQTRAAGRLTHYVFVFSLSPVAESIFLSVIFLRVSVVAMPVRRLVSELSKPRSRRNAIY